MKANVRKRPPKEKNQFRILIVSFKGTNDLACTRPRQCVTGLAFGRLSEPAELSEFRMVLWVKALHIISVIAWMAGMLYLPRLFVYHAEATRGSEASETFKVMERRLLKAIVNPSMILVFLTGFTLVYLTGDWRDGWWQAKFILVLGLAGLHGYFARCVRSFAEDRNERPAHFYRFLNEAPTILMIFVVVLAVVKPF
jgi:protoporphyrinogen IX oxidase